MRKVFFFLFAGIFLAVVFAEESLDLFLERLQRQDENTQTIQFDFDQEIEVSGVTPTQKISGKFYFQAPDKIRLEEKNDRPQIIIFNKKKIWMYDVQLHQALETAVDTFKDFSALALKNFSFNKWSEKEISILKKNYNFSVAKDSSVVCLSLSPLGGVENYPADFTVKIYFSEPDLVPLKNVLTLKSAGQAVTTTVYIRNFRRNEKLSGDLFRLPSGVEVIRPGRD